MILLLIFVKVQIFWVILLLIFRLYLLSYRAILLLIFVNYRLILLLILMNYRLILLLIFVGNFLLLVLLVCFCCFICAVYLIAKVISASHATLPSIVAMPFPLPIGPFIRKISTSKRS